MAVAMEGDTPAEAAPRPAHVGVGFGHDPLLQSLLADREQGRTAALALGTHNMHAPLVVFAGATAAEVKRVLLGLLARLGVDHDLA
jgi:hypothetical protein